MITSLIIATLIILILCLSAYIFYLKYVKKYTRERFAFFSVTALATLISTFILQIYSNIGVVTAFINTSQFLFHINLGNYQTDFKDHVLIFILIVFVGNTILKLHKNWNGPISEQQFNKNRFNTQSTIFDEWVLQLKDFITNKNLIVEHVNKDEDKYQIVFSQDDVDKLPWHVNVYELLSLYSRQYKIDVEKDYYPEQKTFISKYGINNEKIAILCVIDYPENIVLDQFIRFAHSTVSNQKYIVAVKNNIPKVGAYNYKDVEIEFFDEPELLNQLIDFSSYSEFIKEQFIEKEITEGTNITLNDIYVGVDGNIERKEIGRVEFYIAEWLSVNRDNKHLAILAEYGCGKSVLSLKITYDLLLNRTHKSRIPILIELRGKSPRTLNVSEILSIWALAYGINTQCLLKLHTAGKLLLIFEGFDEMDMIGDREMRLQHFQSIWKFATSQSKIIITGRPNFFLDDKELKMNLGIDKSYEGSPYCEAIHLNKFSENQIEEALRKIDINTQKQVLLMLKQSPSTNFYDLISRPAILYLVAVIWKERKLANYQGQINSALIISEFIQYSYSRQLNKNANFPLSEKEREYFMLGVAVGMLSRTGYSNQLSKTDLENIVFNLFKNFPDQFSANYTAIQTKRKSLKERMIDNQHVNETILTDVRTCGILVSDLTRTNYFKFAHKSYFEYLISFYFVESLLQDGREFNVVANAITKSLDINLSTFKYSQETISFTAEILLSKLKIASSNDDKTIGKELFRILYPTRFLNTHPWLAALSDIYVYNLFFAANGLFIVSTLVVFIKLEAIMFPALVIASIILVIVFFKIITMGHTFKRSQIWYKCCKQLNITDNVIHEIVPKKYVSYISEDTNTSFITQLLLLLESILVRRANKKGK